MLMARSILCACVLVAPWNTGIAKEDCDYDLIEFDPTKSISLEGLIGEVIHLRNAGGTACDDQTRAWDALPLEPFPLTQSGGGAMQTVSNGQIESFCLGTDSHSNTTMNLSVVSKAVATNGVLKATYHSSFTVIGDLNDDGEPQAMPCPDATTTNTDHAGVGSMATEIPFLVPQGCPLKLRVKLTIESTSGSDLVSQSSWEEWEPESNFHFEIEGLEGTQISIGLGSPQITSQWIFIPAGEYTFHSSIHPSVGHRFEAPCGNDRIVTSTLDMNASVHVEFALACNADLDCDNDVDTQDLVLLLNDWGTCNGCSADLNCDGVVDFDDQMVLLANWGTCD